MYCTVAVSEVHNTPKILFKPDPGCVRGTPNPKVTPGDPKYSQTLFSKSPGRGDPKSQFSLYFIYRVGKVPSTRTEKAKTDTAVGQGAVQISYGTVPY